MRLPDRPIVTARLRLRRPDESDIPALVALAGDWGVAQTTAFVPHPYGDADARDFLAAAEEERAAGWGARFAIERIGEPGLVGCIGFDMAGGSAEIGYWIGRPFWGRGFATEALRRVVALVFANSAVEEVTAEIMADNAASGRVLEKAGFWRTGAGMGQRGRCAARPVVHYTMSREAWRAAVAEKPLVLVAAAALVDPDGRVLIAKRPDGKAMAGLWEFPGGKVDARETPEAALIRELKEELGVDVTPNCLAPFTFASHDYDDFHLLMPLYVCRVWQGIATPLDGQEIKWVPPARLADFAMPPADVPLVAMLRDFL